jgi:hypothetical protein
LSRCYEIVFTLWVEVVSVGYISVKNANLGGSIIRFDHSLVKVSLYALHLTCDTAQAQSRRSKSPIITNSPLVPHTPPTMAKSDPATPGSSITKPPMKTPGKQTTLLGFFSKVTPAAKHRVEARAGLVTPLASSEVGSSPPVQRVTTAPVTPAESVLESSEWSVVRKVPVP